MTKKDYIFKILDRVMLTRPRAPKIKEYLTKNEDEGYVNYLYDKFVVAVDKTLQIENQDKVKYLSQILANVHEQEVESKKIDEQDIANLENLLNTI